MKETRGGRAAQGLVPWIALLVTLGIAAWWQAVGTGFAQDDFRWLLRAAEGGPISPLAPRVLSATLYFRVLAGLFGPNPVAFHAVQLALHLGTGLLLFLVLAARVPWSRAAAAAAVFLTSPALFDALHWASAITDVLCGACLGLALWLLVARGRETPLGWSWVSVVAFALALASKEVAVGAAPVLAWLHWRRGDRLAWLRAAATLALAVAVVAREATSGRTAAGEPYVVSLSAVWLNLPAYLAAAALGGTAAHVADVTWARLPWVSWPGWSLFAIWVGWLVARRRPDAWLGLAWFLGLLAPVLVLEKQFYFYYLYAALPGLVASLALAAGPGPLRWSPGLRWIAVAVLAVQLAAIQVRLSAHLPTAPLPADFVLRRALIARNAARDIERQRDALRPRVVLLGQEPVDVVLGGKVLRDSSGFVRDAWWDENLRSALSEGEALRALFPEVREVVFKRWLHPMDSSSAIAGYQLDGHLRLASYEDFIGATRSVAGAGVPERLQRAGRFIQQRLFREAYEELNAARHIEPGNPEVLTNLGGVLAQLGDSARAVDALRQAVEVAPSDPVARFNLGLLLWRTGRAADARVTWERLLAESPESDLAMLAKALMEGRAR